MISKKFFNILEKHKFNIMKNINPQYLFFCKQDTESFSTIVLIDDMKYQTKTDSLLLASIKESLEKTFFLRGYKNVDVLFIIFTETPFDYRQLAGEDFKFWLCDVTGKRIISYSLNDSEYTDIRNDIEQTLVSGSAKSSVFSRLGGTAGFINPTFAIIFAIINILIFVGFDLFGDASDIVNMYIYGSSEWHYVLNEHQFYRLFTCMFIHFDISHLVSNMTSLLALGTQLEPNIGHIRFTIIYIVSGLCASLTSVLYHYHMDMNILSAGASGAVFGLFGAYAVYALFDKLKGNHVSAARIAAISILVLFNGMNSASVDNAAHLGGLITGCIIAFICCITDKNKI